MYARVCVVVYHQQKQIQHHKLIQSCMFFKISGLSPSELFWGLFHMTKLNLLGCCQSETLIYLSSPAHHRKLLDSIWLIDQNCCIMLQSKIPSLWNNPSTALWTAFCDGFCANFIAESISDVDTITFRKKNMWTTNVKMSLMYTNIDGPWTKSVLIWPGLLRQRFL